MSHNSTHEKNVARGLKAALHNDNVSTSAKEHAAQQLTAMGEDVPKEYTEHHNHVLAGYKAALKNPNVSEQAKEHAAQVLEDSSYPNHRQPHTSGAAHSREKSPNRVLGGYKAALKNPNVSESAKEHAEEVLKESKAY